MEYVYNDCKIKIPEEFNKGMDMPDVPLNSTCIYLKTQDAKFIGFIYPLEDKRVMPLDDNERVITGIHNALNENQGLIEVNNGVTNNGNEYAYSIVKTKLESIGVEYFLCIHLKIGDSYFSVNLHCAEAARTGKRESIILDETILKEEKELDMSKWSYDPYDKNFDRGLLMNLSEHEKYDERFPSHPLSMARNFIKYIIENN